MATQVPAEPDTLRMIYQEVCKGHGAIADFRAKLLALLPLASGAGIALLLNGKGLNDAQPLLTAIGIFGFTVTFGLFMYELRGIQDCVLLRSRATELEKKLNVPPECSQFGGRGRGRMGGLVDEIGAGWIVYPAVMASWLYVAGRGANVSDHFSAWPWLLGNLYVVVVLVGLLGSIHRADGGRDRQTTPSTEA